MTDASKACPQCHLINPVSARVCDCGYRFDEYAAVETKDPTQVRSVRLAWSVAAIWGAITILIAAVGPALDPARLSPEQSLGHFFSAAIIISLALAVKRGSRIGAWLLVGYIAVELAVRVSTGAWLLGPLILLGLTITAAIDLQRHSSSARDRDAWRFVLYELAFLQGALMAILVLWSLWTEPIALRQFVGSTVRLWHLLDVAILWGLGFGVFKRAVWAGYALAIYQVGNCYLVIVDFGWDGANIGPIAMAILYGVGAVYLHRAHGPLRGFGRVAVLLAIVLIVANSAWIGRTRYSRAANDLGSQLLLIPGMKERLAGQNQERVVAITRTIAIRGARRLSDTQLVERARLLGVILQLLDEHTCADQLRGGQASVESALLKLDQVTRRAWFDLVVAASVAELKGSPEQGPTPTEEAIAEGVTAIMANLPAEDADRFLSVQSNASQGEGKSFAQTSDADACWYLLTVVESVARLDGKNQRTIARLLISE
jgi:hypothetical protein